MRLLFLCLLIPWFSACERQPRVLKNESAEPAPPAQPTGPPPPGMVLIPAGSFLMGENAESRPHNGPVHRVTLRAFYMDETEVTNAQFAEFVNATGHKTLAEMTPKPEDFPGVDPALLKPGANFFVGTQTAVQTFTPQAEIQWWEYRVGASWKQPTGPGSSIAGRENQPVVCINWDDASAYAKWAGKRLPTEAEWEYAARGGLEQKEYVWGDEFKPGGKYQSNIWQGEFPNQDSAADGFHGLAPVKSYAPNGYGLYDMSGNVWEWVNDWFAPDYYLRSPSANPPGSAPVPDMERGGGQPCKVMRGGSWLCNDCYCGGYRPGARQWTTPDTSANHTGFRCVKDL
jgi:formylglycine-generating enzyme